jgi:N-acetylneuraminic acid mutarotase
MLSQRVETSLPSAVQETAAAATATNLYVIGGYDANGQSVASVFVFDGARWADGPTLPIAVNHPAAAVLNGDVYVAGGFTSGSATNRVFVLARGATAWTEVSSMHASRAAAALLAVGQYLYAIGGLAGSTQIAQVERYDPATNAWTDLTQLSHPRNHVAGYVDGQLACVAGGREPSTSNSVDCLDTTTTSWRPGIPLPTPTSGAAAGLVNGVLTVTGGESSGETALVPLVQELRGISWSSQPMTDPRHGTAYAQFQGRFWMCGGATAPGYHASTTCTSMTGA